MRLLMVAMLAVSCGGPMDGSLATDEGDLKKCKAPAGCCGDGVLHPGEACDTGGLDTATCDGSTCLPPRCGDGRANAAAGEVCDEGGNTLTCDADCTPAACGDAFVNPVSEGCDTGGAVVPGCSVQCQLACGP